MMILPIATHSVNLWGASSFLFYTHSVHINSKKIFIQNFMPSKAARPASPPAGTYNFYNQTSPSLPSLRPFFLYNVKHRMIINTLESFTSTKLIIPFHISIGTHTSIIRRQRNRNQQQRIHDRLQCCELCRSFFCRQQLKTDGRIIPVCHPGNPRNGETARRTERQTVSIRQVPGHYYPLCPAN